MLVSSLKLDAQPIADTASLRAFLPLGDIGPHHDASAFDRAPVGRFLLDSVIVTGATVVRSPLVSSPAGFGFVVLRWRGAIWR